MRLMSERNQVRSVADMWLGSYGLDRTYGADTRGRNVGEELLAMDAETASAADVAEIIGTPSWVRPCTCDECGTRSWGIVEVGEMPDYESCTVYLCEGCLRAALSLLGKV